PRAREAAAADLRRAQVGRRQGERRAGRVAARPRGGQRRGATDLDRGPSALGRRGVYLAPARPRSDRARARAQVARDRARRDAASARWVGMRGSGVKWGSMLADGRTRTARPCERAVADDAGPGVPTPRMPPPPAAR